MIKRDILGTYSFETGADGFGGIVFSATNDGGLRHGGNPLFANGNPLTVSGGGTQTLSITDSDNVLIMTVRVNDNGTYDVTPIVGVISVEQDLGLVNLNAFSGGNNDEYAAIDAIPNETLDIIPRD